MSTKKTSPQIPPLKDLIIPFFGLQDFNEEQQEQASMSLTRIIFQKLLIRVWDILPEDERNELADKIENEKGDGSLVIQYLEDKVPNLLVIIREEMDKLKADTAIFNTIKSSGPYDKNSAE